MALENFDDKKFGCPENENFQALNKYSQDRFKNPLFKFLGGLGAVSAVAFLAFLAINP